MDVPEIDIEQLDVVRSAGGFVLDVREPDEWASARLSGAVAIPMMEIPDRITEVPTGEAVYVLCARGGRSLRAAGFLRSHGVEAVNVAGGMVAWCESGRPIESGPTR